MATVLDTPGSKTNPHIKDPDALLDYYEDWSDFLIPVADTMDFVEIIVSDPDATIEANTTHHPTNLANNDGLIAQVWAQGGRLDETEEMTLRMHSVGGRIDDRTMFFKMKAK